MFIIIAIVVTLISGIVALIKSLIPKKVGYLFLLVVACAGIYYFLLYEPPQKNGGKNKTTIEKRTIMEKIKENGNKILQTIGLQQAEPLPQMEEWSCKSCQERWEKMKKYGLDKIIYVTLAVIGLVIAWNTYDHYKPYVVYKYYEKKADWYKKDRDENSRILALAQSPHQVYNEREYLLSKLFWSLTYPVWGTYGYVKSKIKGDQMLSAGYEETDDFEE